MTALNLTAVMDAIAALLTAETSDQAYAYPPDAAVSPCWIVGYPPDIDYDAVFGRGSDRAVFPVFRVVPRNDPKSARDALSAVISQANDIKAVLDGTLSSTVQSARVTSCKPSFIEIGGVPELAAEFSLEVYS